jgi:cell division septum initiation protein DivIVA
MTTRHALPALLLIVAIAAAFTVGRSTTPPRATPPVAPTPTPDPVALRQHAWERAQRYIRGADAETDAVLRQALDDLRRELDAAKAGADDFADVALSWTSTWRLAVSRLPFTDGDGHRRFLDQAFRRHVLPDGHLERATARAVEAVLRAAADADARIVAALRADLDTLPARQDGLAAPFRRPGPGLDALVAESAKATSVVAGQAVTHAALTAAADAIAQRIVRLVAGRLAARAGFVAATGPWTLGTSLVAAVVVDYILTKIVGLFYDPRAAVVAGQPVPRRPGPRPDRRRRRRPRPARRTRPPAGPPPSDPRRRAAPAPRRRMPLTLP